MPASFPCRPAARAGVRAGRPVVRAAGQARVGVPPARGVDEHRLPLALGKRCEQAAERQAHTPAVGGCLGRREARAQAGRGRRGALGELVHAAGGASPALAAMVVDGLVSRDDGDAGTDEVEGLHPSPGY